MGYNSTHYENVNKALWIAGLAERKEYDNEFNADTWDLYVRKTDLGQTPVLIFPLFLIVALLIGIVAIAALLAIIVHSRKSSKRHISS